VFQARSPVWLPSKNQREGRGATRGVGWVYTFPVGCARVYIELSLTELPGTMGNEGTRTAVSLG
jgi:hypothetical protein